MLNCRLTKQFSLLGPWIPAFFLNEVKKEKLEIRGRYRLNPVYDFIMIARSRSCLVVIDVFGAAGEFRVKSILLRKLKQA